MKNKKPKKYKVLDDLWISYYMSWGTTYEKAKEIVEDLKNKELK
jgi:hypothetical protein